MDIYIKNKKLYADAQYTLLIADSGIKISYGDTLECTLHFEAGTVSAGDEILATFDSDMLFGENGTSPMAMNKHIIQAGETEACTITLQTNTERFYDVVNGQKVPVPCYFGIYQHKANAEDEALPQIELGLSTIYALPVVALYSDTIVPLEPADLYYTKEEIDGAFAPLNASSKVPTANLPFAGPYNGSEYPAGILRLASNRNICGLEIYGAGNLTLYAATDANIASRASNPTYKSVISPANLNTAVKAALTDNSHITLTTAQQNTAKTVLSVYNQSITAIPAATSEYALSDGNFSHIPETAPIYTLPDVGDTSKTHTIVIVVDFTNTGSIAFQDLQGTTIAPLPSASTIAQGKTFAFLCTYQALLSKWVIMTIDLEGA